MDEPVLGVVPYQPGIPLWVEGTQRRLLALTVHGVAPGTLPVWTANVDGSLGCGGTMDAAVVLAARAADSAARLAQ